MEVGVARCQGFDCETVAGDVLGNVGQEGRRRYDLESVVGVSLLTLAAARRAQAKSKRYCDGERQ
jgi:hypothetical protein